MRVLHLAAILSLLAPTAFAPAALAQNNTDQMLELARKVRAQAEQMKGQLPPEDIAEMLKQADELEAGARDGAFNAPPPPPPGLAQRIADAHGGRLDWLARETVCTGYSWENYRTFRLTTGDRDAERDALCRTAYGHWADYFRITRDGGGTAQGDPHLAAYDRAAQAAVDFYQRR
jgi:hypothetical protein